jgi:hypothetical protein
VTQAIITEKGQVVSEMLDMARERLVASRRPPELHQ